MDGFMLATVGDSGTHVNLWDSVSYALLVKIFTPGSQVRLLRWASNNVELLVGCQEGRVKVYGIERKPDVVSAYFLREQAFMHK
jgi:WD40 repeat protein